MAALLACRLLFFGRNADRSIIFVVTEVLFAVHD